MTFKPKYLTGILFVFVLTVVIATSMAMGVWKTEKEDHKSKNVNPPANTTTNTNDLKFSDWCSQNQASLNCAGKTLGIEPKDFSMPVAEVAQMKGTTPEKMKDLIQGCKEKQDPGFEEEEENENENENERSEGFEDDD